ncbi:carboxypeptidase S [Vararia minispora EC-137]|uniref:Carboxypeptidase S n=1 Tax=Vararia minispora EC-137 TaxID=1314806 RepID=A0ACB8QM48_9AGAM|nr:carboxypeptidase S [Vararia minispora EC-137]
MSPTKHRALLDDLEKLYANETYREWAYESLGAVVRVPTVTFDDIGLPGEDPRWNTRLLLHGVLEKRFPLVHSTLKKTVINTYALVYHWQGSDTSLKPILLTAHQDVVPVNPDTEGEWIHSPFSGYFDGEWIWGRGSCDDKSGLVSTLTTIETLIMQEYQPTRTVVLAYGIDEERGGVDGAKKIKDYLLGTYGCNGISLLVDEGGGWEDRSGTIFASPNVAEKGKLNVRIEVMTRGGHSSVPPPHTGIGYLSTIVTELEAHPLPAVLERGTYFQSLQCSAAHDPGLSNDLRELIKNASKDGDALKRLQEVLAATNERQFRAITGTTQAIDLVGGGVKVNALPEYTWAVADHRIADWSSVAELQQRYIDVLTPVTSALNLTFDPFGLDLYQSTHTPSAGHVRLSDAYGTALNPAPITPTDGNSAWELLSGTIKSSLKTSSRTPVGTAIIVAPGLSLGNTDTRHYWNLTKNIFRYAHGGADDRYNGAHTVNEAIRAEGFLEMIRFHTRLILNADESVSLE